MAENKNYRFLLFDADNTLFDFDLAENKAYRAAFAQSGASGGAPPEGIFERYHEINLSLWKAHERGEITKDFLIIERHRKTFAEFGISADAAEFNKHYLKNLGESRDLLPGAQALCRSLSERERYRMFIITNGVAASQLPRFGGSPLREYFEDIFVSETVGAQKPDKLFFDHALGRIRGFDLKRDRNASLVIGDSPTSDIAGANNAGIDCCWFNPNGLPCPSGARPDYVIKELSELFTIV